MLTAFGTLRTAITWTASASVVVAAVAVLVSIVLGLWSLRIAKRALSISEVQEARWGSHFKLELEDALSFRSASGTGRLIGIHVLISNPMDRSSSITRSELHLTYRVGETAVVVKVPHDRTPSPELPGSDPIILPKSLEANQAVSGWFLFRISESLTSGRSIDRYELFVSDVHDIVEGLHITAFREMTHAEEP